MMRVASIICVCRYRSLSSGSLGFSNQRLTLLFWPQLSLFNSNQGRNKWAGTGGQDNKHIFAPTFTAATGIVAC
jgi:hypothetical protein